MDCRADVHKSATKSQGVQKRGGRLGNQPAQPQEEPEPQSPDSPALVSERFSPAEVLTSGLNTPTLVSGTEVLTSFSLAPALVSWTEVLTSFFVAPALVSGTEVFISPFVVPALMSGTKVFTSPFVVPDLLPPLSLPLHSAGRSRSSIMQSPAAGTLCRPLVPQCCSAPMSVPGGRRSSGGNRRRASPPVTMRDNYGTSSVSSSNSGSCKGSDSSPSTRRAAKYTLCSENHGIKPPTPEQYLTPLQQKEVCIRHLRARLKDMQDALHERDSEVDELRSQLSRMQEDWIEEECHRVEAQLALKAAQREIQQLREVMDSVRSRLGEDDSGVQKYFADITLQNRKLETLLQSMELAQNGAPRGADGGGSAGDSPARSLTRSSTYTKLSEPPAGDRHSQDTGDSGFAAPDDSSAVSSGTEFCLGEGPLCLGVHHPPLCVEAAVQASSVSDCGVQTDAVPGTPEPDAILEKVLQSHAAGSPSSHDEVEQVEFTVSHDPSCVVLVTDGATGGESGAEEPDAPLSYWSRHFVVDLLAVLIPVVPTVAWLCRAQRRQGQPVYNISSLMRGCCSVALHSIRRISCRPVGASPGQP
ncbi:syntaphilin [Rhinophrynus dorsalis]